MAKPRLGLQKCKVYEQNQPSNCHTAVALQGFQAAPFRYCAMGANIIHRAATQHGPTGPLEAAASRSVLPRNDFVVAAKPNGNRKNMSLKSSSLILDSLVALAIAYIRLGSPSPTHTAIALSSSDSNIYSLRPINM